MATVESVLCELAETIQAFVVACPEAVPELKADKAESPEKQENTNV